jgi:tRNA(Ile)-lysidine synthase TilS/MesJ
VVKRYLMNRACVDGGYTVLATGHNLDDEASALLGNLLYWKEEYLYKKGIVLESRGTRLAKKVKPFFYVRRESGGICNTAWDRLRLR